MTLDEYKTLLWVLSCLTLLAMLLIVLEQRQ